MYVELPHRSDRARTVSDSIVETLVAWGITHVFGMVGHSNLGLADALAAAEQRGDLTYIGIRHEGAASFAASAYAKLTGRPAACIAIAGPGSTNMLTGLYDAKVDRAPVVVHLRAGAIEGARPGRIPRPRSRRRVRRRGAVQPHDPSRIGPFRVDALAVKHALDDRDGHPPDRARRGAGAAGHGGRRERSRRSRRPTAVWHRRRRR